MKIVSLLPAATEMVCLLGLEKNLVGISDDNDYPESVLKLPKITTTTISSDLSSLEIDKRVKAAKHRGSSVFHIDRVLLSKLAPDLILTQELCPVCAPAFTDVEKAAGQVLGNTKIVSLQPHTIDDIFENISIIAQYVIPDLIGDPEKELDSRTPRGIFDFRGNDDTQQKAIDIIKSLKLRLSNIAKKIVRTKKPSVLIIEWLDPLMIAGHWVPEMVERAGGNMLIAKKKEPSRYIVWDDILKLNPDIIIIAPCGFRIDRTLDEISLLTEKKDFKKLKAYKNGNIFLVDGNAYLTRPGPRIVDGVEILAEIFHPQFFDRKYPPSSWQKLEV